MSFQTTESLRRLYARLGRELLDALPPDQRDAVRSQLDQRLQELLGGVASASGGTFADLMGLGTGGAGSFDEIPLPRLDSDFDDAVIPTQLHAAAELYYIYQHERMRVFQVANTILRLFHDGTIRIQRGPGARLLYLIEKQRPFRYTPQQRQLAYRRVFHYGTVALPSTAVSFSSFHRVFVAFIAAIAQYFRDLLIGEVIRGGSVLGQRPFGSQAEIERLGTDLRWGLDRHTYGHIVPLTLEVGTYLKTVLEALETPDIKKAFDANTKWDVIEFVSQRYLGGVADISQRSKMAESGRDLLLYAADNPFRAISSDLFQAEVRPHGSRAESWLAAYRMVPEGRGFRGIQPALQDVLGRRSIPQRAA